MFEKTFPAVFDLRTLNGTNGFTVHGLAQGDCFGTSIRTTGDINGDGKNDVVLGAYLSNAGQGASYVIFGQNSFPASFDLRSLNGTNGFSVVGVGGVQGLGISVSTAGDINHDGRDDVVLGAHLTNNYQGAAYVIFGQRNFPVNFDLRSLNGTNGFGLLGVSVGSALGVSVSPAGDVNGDGKDDLLVSAEGTNNGAGAAYVIYGQTTFPTIFDLGTLNGSNGFAVHGLAQGDGLGISVNRVGDMNGDGKADIALGAFGVDAHAGAVYVIFGESNFPASFNLKSLNGVNGFIVSGLSAGNCLSMVNTAGDMNGDGKDDLVIGTLCDVTLYSANVAYVIFGQSSFPASFDLRSLNGNNGFAVPGLNTDDALGVSVGTAGDINSDGKDDVMLGAWGANNYQGAAYVIFGQSNFPASFDLRSLKGVNGFMLQGLTAGDRLGFWSINAAGDIQGNGKSNIVIGAYGVNNSQGASYVIFGETPTIPTPIPTPIVIHHPPIVLNSPVDQVVEVNKPFFFEFEARQVFNSTDGDPLTFSVQSHDGSPLPGGVYFNTRDSVHLTFTGQPVVIEDTTIGLLAKNPWNQTAQTNFSLSAVAPSDSSSDIKDYLVGGAVGFSLGALIGLGYGFYKKFCSKDTEPTRAGYEGLNEKQPLSIN